MPVSYSTAQKALACLASALLLPASIYIWGPLVAFALSPAIVVFCLEKQSWRVCLAAWLTGWLVLFLTQHTLWIVSLKGIATLSCYLALTWIPVAYGVRTLWKRWRIPLTLSWPIAWGAGEALRSMGPLGTTFGVLTVPRTVDLWMLQVVDIGGSLMASIPLAMLQGWFADLLLQRWAHGYKQNGKENGVHYSNILKNRTVQAMTVLVAMTWGAVAVYGHLRIRQIESEMKTGPYVAVIAPDIPALGTDHVNYDPGLLLEKLKTFTESAVSGEHRPELVLWPEGILNTLISSRSFISASFEPRMAKYLYGPDEPKPSEQILRARWQELQQYARVEEEAFADWVNTLGVPVVIGTEAKVPAPPERSEPFLPYNAAIVYDPETGPREDFQPKVRLYPVGEFSPARGTSFESLVERFVGSARHEFAAGDVRHRYKLEGHDFSFVISLCSEMKFNCLRGEMPPLQSGEKPFDFMVNIANEGLFHRNDTLDIFAFSARLRAIENRVTLARSSNGGISGFWSPTGQSYGLVTNEMGQARAGLGTPEIPLIKDLIEFRKKYESDFATDASLRAELQQRLGEIDALRETAGVEGWAVQPIYLSKGSTLFQRTGDWLGPLLILALVCMNLFGGFLSIRTALNLR